MIEIARGDLLQANVDALVNAVNTEGVMGKGIALQFRRAYPTMFDAYVADCKNGRVRLGRMNVFDLGDSELPGPRWIINFPTKGHWKSQSRLRDIRSGLVDLVDIIRQLKIKSIALPPLGCCLGGLEWSDVGPMMECALSQAPDVTVLLFVPPSK